MVGVVHKLPKKHKLLILGLAAAMAVLFVMPSDDAVASKDNTGLLEVGKRYEVNVPLNDDVKTTQVTPASVNKANETAEIPTSQVEESPLNYHDFTVRKGDNLAVIFKRAGFSAQTLHKLVNSDKHTKKLTNIHPGEVLSFAKNADGELAALKYELNRTDTLHVTLSDAKKYRTHITSKTIEVVEQYAAGKITSNFWSAGIAAGLTQKQIMNFAAIFEFDVDFANDIRKNDTFALIYETNHIEGEFVGTGKIVAAEFINQGERFRAVRHDDGNFYTPEGRSMKKAFMRAPVNFKYVSSSFNPRRKHPVTGKIKAHRGIDYAAKTGTPVMASGNGKVIRAGYSKYNGNYVFMQHGNTYVTKYLHLHKRKVKRGQRVKQGQVIGTVGATGRVTGPHLHYEFLVNGVHRNPRTVKLPKAESLPKTALKRFKPIAEQYLARIEKNKALMLAMN